MEYIYYVEYHQRGLKRRLGVFSTVDRSIDACRIKDHFREDARKAIEQTSKYIYLPGSGTHTVTYYIFRLKIDPTLSEDDEPIWA